MATDHPDVSTRTSDALRASQLYYLQDLTMEAIAHELGTSRSSVSRLLSHARETGLVDIRVRSPREMPNILERQILESFGVSAHVVPVPDHTSDVDRLERVALSAARMLGEYIDSNTTLGVAWGATVSAVSRHLVPRSVHDTQIVQLNGAGNLTSTGIVYASEILRRFGEAFNAQVQQFPVPAFFDDPLTKQALWRERSMQRVLALQEHLDVALFGVGSPFAEVPSHVYSSNFLDSDDLASLQEERVVGDVATVFYRADGSTDGIRLNERGSGPAFDVLRRTPRRICVVSGAARLASIRGAIAARLITDLFVDEGTARLLVASHSDRARLIATRE
ncbi:sugar-binding transcriptional regulator [Leifsonia sp. Leaf264]|uniref:sugar-binding transcriptional regulator n=1 Tax=Leifsonia sp. Leaf264 TaxID=1736314 RepID=UPI0006FB1BE6|nr:sugar-binding domain-containing protein [Leifsonia sp. Leaf264]KQO99382.1 transcriptional regulator [Leifsonia sp. Leaf264]